MLPTHQLLTVWKVSHHLRVSPSVIYELVALGDLPSVRVGKLIRIPRQAFLDWLAAQSGGGEEGGKNHVEK